MGGAWVLQDGMSWFMLDLQKRKPAQGILPELLEQWTWEEDTTILPFKWEQALADSCEEPVVLQAAKPWDAHDFDPSGMFFVTHRSETSGIAAALAAGRDEGVIAVLGVHPSFRKRGIGRCLLRFALQRHAALQRKRVFCAVQVHRLPGMVHLLSSEGFQPSAVGPASSS